MTYVQTIADQISRQLLLIQNDKLATHCDLDACFMLHDLKRGYLGDIFQKASAPTINRLLVARYHTSDIQAYSMPSTLAAGSTRALLDRLYPSSTTESRQRRAEREWLCAVTGLDALLPPTNAEDCPDRLNLFYVGDFLDCVDEAISLNARIKNSIMRHDGANTLEILKRLTDVPDYSHHFPNRRPPGPGKKQGIEENRPVSLPIGGLRPA